MGLPSASRSHAWYLTPLTSTRNPWRILDKMNGRQASQSKYQKMHISGVTKGAHDAGKRFCQERGLQLGVWVSQAIRKEIKRQAQREKEAQARVMLQRRRRTDAMLREHVIACDLDEQPANQDMPIEAMGPPFWEREDRE